MYTTEEAGAFRAKRPKFLGRGGRQECNGTRNLFSSYLIITAVRVNVILQNVVTYFICLMKGSAAWTLASITGCRSSPNP